MLDTEDKFAYYKAEEEIVILIAKTNIAIEFAKEIQNRKSLPVGRVQAAVTAELGLLGLQKLLREEQLLLNRHVKQLNEQTANSAG